MSLSSSEAVLQRWFIQRLREKGVFASKLVFASYDGAPDLYTIRSGTTILIELKNGRGVLRPAQKQMHRLLHDKGATVITLHGQEECQKYLTELHEYYEPQIFNYTKGGI